MTYQEIKTQLDANDAQIRVHDRKLVAEREQLQASLRAAASTKVLAQHGKKIKHYTLQIRLLGYANANLADKIEI